MKLGNKSESKPVECNDNILDSVGFKNISESLKEKQKESTYYLEDMRADADPLSHRVDDRTASELGHTFKVDDLTNDAEKAVPPNHSQVEADSFDDPVFYVDKSVLERQLPELIVCFKENTYQIVKDICIDEGVPSQYKILFDTDEDVDCNLLCPFLPENDLKDEIVKEKVELVLPVPDALKSSLAKENLDLRQQIPEELKFLEGLSSLSCSSSDFDTRDSRPTRDEKLETYKKIVNFVPKETSMLGDLLIPDRGADLSYPKSSDSIEESKQQPVQNQREKAQLETVSTFEEHHSYDEGAVLTSPPMVSRAEESDNGSEDVSLITASRNSAANDLGHSFNKIDMASLVLIAAAEESENVCEEVDSIGASLTSESEEVDNVGKEAKWETDAYDCAFKTLPDIAADEPSFGSKVNSGINSFDWDSSAPVPSCGQSCLQNAEECFENQGILIPQNSITEPVLNHPRYSPGETSFSASDPLSGLISYSGPIAYSGSLSIRSDSSTTSTRSFAFPILQSEWNSSPVRMAKAECKQFGRRRRWRHSLLCCRF